MPRTVQLSDDAYRTLAALKRPNESFSLTIRRLASGRKDPHALRRLKPVRSDFDLEDLRRRMALADRRGLTASRSRRR